MDESPIEVRPRTLNDVMSEMGRGVLRIPRFQRDYVWEATRVAKLFDSIYKGFPIGSFFYWITPQEYRDHYRDIPELKLPTPENYDQIKMILDGQQRITSLYVTANGLSLPSRNGREKDYRKICFDLETEKFESVKRREDRQKTVSLWRFFAQEGEDEIYDSLSPEKRRVFKKCKTALNSYPMSIVEVKGKHLDDAITIFERINQGGKRLGLFDLVVANTWSEDFDLKEKTKELNSALEESGFGKIAEEVVAQALALVIKNGCTKSYQIQLTNEEIRRHWQEVSDAIRAAVDFLRSHLGVRIYDFIPYPSMIALVAYMYAKVPSRSLNAIQAQFIQDWFWRSAFSERYGASTHTVMGLDTVDYFTPAMQDNPPKMNFPINIQAAGIARLMNYTRSAVKNAILCLLALQQPRHFRTGTPIILDDQLCSDYNHSEKHHIFPKAFLRSKEVKHRHLLMNFAFIPGELNREISKRGPSDYLSEYKAGNPVFQEIMQSHLIPAEEGAAIWTDDYDRFIQDRANLIFSNIERVIGTQEALETKMRDAPTKLVDELERLTRVYFNDKLSLDFGPDYWPHIPSDIQDRVTRKIEERMKRHPYEKENALTNLERLGFCDIMDYNGIIGKTWKVFEEDFGSIGEVQKHFLNIKEYRNALMHGREMNRVEKKQGEASVEWLMQIISEQ